MRGDQNDDERGCWRWGNAERRGRAVAPCPWQISNDVSVIVSRKSVSVSARAIAMTTHTNMCTRPICLPPVRPRVPAAHRPSPSSSSNTTLSNPARLCGPRYSAPPLPAPFRCPPSLSLSRLAPRWPTPLQSNKSNGSSPPPNRNPSLPRPSTQPPTTLTIPIAPTPPQPPQPPPPPPQTTPP